MAGSGAAAVRLIAPADIAQHAYEHQAAYLLEWSVYVTTTEHRQAEGHQHTHGPGCGHASVLHGDHVDYLHDGHLHREHATEGGVHYDECTTCTCEHCSDSCAVCVCADCTCPTCNHAICSCERCSDACNNCACADCTCPACTHAA